MHDQRWRLWTVTLALLLLGCPEQDPFVDDDTAPGDDDAADPCQPDPCNGHGDCLALEDGAFACECHERYGGEACDECAETLENYPDCEGCLSDDECVDPPLPYCVEGSCVECRDDNDPAPAGLCEGVCTLEEPLCIDHSWFCWGPGYESVEVSCDGFDNDCDGQTDEGVCPDCSFRLDEIQANLYSMWDIDFDFDCNSYLTTLISGPDYTTVVPHTAADPTESFYGNANQNMGFALVDPDPDNRRVVVVYACCPTCGCQASNGLTLLYTCDPADPDCGCIDETNCPGFLDDPFLVTGYADTTVMFNGRAVSTPTGLAVGPENTYYVGNYLPGTCSDDPGCTPCDPDHPDEFCVPSQPNCCDTTPMGRLALFTLPTEVLEPSWRVVAILEGEEIIGLATGRSGVVWVGTHDGAGEGRLYEYRPSNNAVTQIATFDGTVFSITQNRFSGDWYLEVDGFPKIHRLLEDGTPAALPVGVPDNPAGQGVLQWGPDDRLYRLLGAVGSQASIDIYELN